MQLTCAPTAAAFSFEAALHGAWGSDMLRSFEAGAWPEFFKSLPVPANTAQHATTTHHFHHHMPALPAPYLDQTSANFIDINNNNSNNNHNSSSSMTSSSSSSSSYSNDSSTAGTAAAPTAAGL
jgi:hypothetical protein